MSSSLGATPRRADRDPPKVTICEPNPTFAACWRRLAFPTSGSAVRDVLLVLVMVAVALLEQRPGEPAGETDGEAEAGDENAGFDGAALQTAAFSTEDVRLFFALCRNRRIALGAARHLSLCTGP